ncbi:MAG TPA: ATP-binding protein [Streptosporangiaceae bacterium]|nr:ATP-binding protein [Streptosporangiaceae bacterium]
MNSSSLELQLARDTPALAAERDLEVRGLLHDLGHQVMTLSLLADSVCDDGALSATAGQRMKIVKQEIFRIVELITDSMSPDAASARTEMIDLRQAADEVAQLVSMAHGTAVTVQPGGPAMISVSTSLLWRVLRNLVDNAVRAAGPGGQVSIRIEQKPQTVLEITDTGPGFGFGPSGATGLGLTVVRNLLHAAGGRLDIGGDPEGGTRVRVTFGPGPGYGGQQPVLADAAPAIRQPFEASAEPPARMTLR